MYTWISADTAEVMLFLLTFCPQALSELLPATAHVIRHEKLSLLIKKALKAQFPRLDSYQAYTRLPLPAESFC